MKKLLMVLLAMLVLSSVFAPALQAQDQSPEKLLIVYTTADAEVFNKMIFAYASYSKSQGWWDEIEVLIWGPSSNAVAESNDLQDKIKQLKEAGVIVTACKWCADQYEASEILAKAGVDVKYMGKPLTDMVKSDCKVLTF